METAAISRGDAQFAALFPRGEQAMALRLRRELVAISKRDLSALHPDQPMSEWRVGVDSLDNVEWMMVIEELARCRLPDHLLDEDRTFREWVKALTGKAGFGDWLDGPPLAAA